MDFPASKYVIVKAEILPPVYLKVLQAKKMLADGEVASATQAARLCGVSRSAYYKYKDAVFESAEVGGESTVTIEAKLTDNAGVLSNVMNEIYRAGANVLSINQSAPMGGTATVSIVVRIARMVIAAEELVSRVRAIPGVKTAALS
ncbi:MAG: ACT domain-containing protein [Clostridiales bacterium]|uniref:ACT domain-containing protein n=1 Tax=Candidatus Scybalenecus merdavium TaxID=2840939 RepID=A0A9D1SP52_9FIRM|nr:ACT domain-containing protein [Clostridiales bacterium]HIU69215.1 ACT domain-containing protein [Candidatus Scubalenecus merdavium]